MDIDTLGKFVLFVIVLAVLISLIYFLMNNSNSLALGVLTLPKL